MSAVASLFFFFLGRAGSSSNVTPKGDFFFFSEARETIPQDRPPGTVPLLLAEVGRLGALT